MAFRWDFTVSSSMPVCCYCWCFHCFSICFLGHIRFQGLNQQTCNDYSQLHKYLLEFVKSTLYPFGFEHSWYNSNYGNGCCCMASENTQQEMPTPQRNPARCVEVGAIKSKQLFPRSFERRVEQTPVMIVEPPFSQQRHTSPLSSSLSKRNRLCQPWFVVIFAQKIVPSFQVQKRSVTSHCKQVGVSFTINAQS